MARTLVAAITNQLPGVWSVTVPDDPTFRATFQNEGEARQFVLGKWQRIPNITFENTNLANTPMIQVYQETAGR